MKNDIFNFLDGLGIVWKYMANGLIGGFIWSLYKKSKFWEALRQIIIGGFISGYFSPVIITKYKMDLSLAGFSSFIVGMLGMVIVDTAYKYITENFQKWILILQIFFFKEGPKN